MNLTAPPNQSVTTTARQTAYRASDLPRRPTHQIALVMLAAFSLSIVHTVYAWLAGIEDPGFTVTTPLAWGFYLVALAVTALALREERWAQLVVLVFLVLVLLIGIFYYPTMFEPRQQTTFGWFENDVYLGLLMLAFYLGIQRFRGVALVATQVEAGPNLH